MSFTREFKNAYIEAIDIFSDRDSFWKCRNQTIRGKAFTRNFINRRHSLDSNYSVGGELSGIHAGLLTDIITLGIIPGILYIAQTKQRKLCKESYVKRPVDNILKKELKFG